MGKNGFKSCFSLENMQENKSKKQAKIELLLFLAMMCYILGFAFIQSYSSILFFVIAILMSFLGMKQK